MLFPPAGPPDVEPSQQELKPVLRDDPKFAAGKIAVFQYAAVGIFLFLISGFWALQVQNEDYYSARAERNRIKSIPILAPRGKILDRDGRVIVDNHSSFSLILSREGLKPEHIKPIAEGLRLDYDALMQRLNRYRGRPKYEAMVVKEEMTPADLSFVDSHHDFFPELEVIPAQRRLYPQNGFAAHVIGYTGEIGEDELNNASFAHYNPGDVIGKSGIERQYNETLMGVDGQRQVVVDNRGQPRRLLGLKDAVPGKDLQLTLDLDLQAVAELAMEGRKGAVVALDPRTGEVLAMVSRPTFDPNKFAVRIRSVDWREIADNPDKPLLNRVIQAQLAPGSTFKPVMQLAGLETGVIDPAWSVRCGGGASFYGRYFKCWEKRGHGTVDAHRGMTHSCDVYFYNVGNKLGIDKIAYYAQHAGLGGRAGIDLPNEAEGVVPSQQWVMRNYRRKWYAGETISVSIGQGALTVTPLQLARAIGGIAVGGTWHHPHLLKDLNKTEKPDVLTLNPENVKTVIDGMFGVVNEGGTGVRARLPNVEVCGKTGTAQLASNQFLSGKSARHLRDNAWFVGFAPRQAPEIVVVALWENGEHGNYAAPIVRDVLKAYFDKKVRLASHGGKPQPAGAQQMIEMQGTAPVEEALETSPEPPSAETAPGPQQ
ncbi:MAG TPA: penicillin-binding protein 2 [Bryobacteraceae bacterium]|nr:penicillin-binding protein 2 [Bryobacteraceae bacterium]